VGVASTSHVNGLRYRYLLGTILLSFLIIIAIPAQFIGAPLRVVVLGGLLQMTLRMRRRAGSWARPAWILSAILLVATVIAALTGSAKVLGVIAESSTVVLVGAAIGVLATTLQASKVVDGSVVRGVLSVYLLLALLFAAIDELGATLTSHYLHGVSAATASDTLYFSVITITTVGYGDITPGNNLAQAVAASEALVGQLYLVSVVAVVVSRYRAPDRSTDGEA
jgi:ion channel